MKLRIGEDRIAVPVDANGRTPSIDVRLAYRESSNGLAVEIAHDGDPVTVPVCTVAIPLHWVADAFDRAFYFDGAPVPLEDVLNEDSEMGSVARADACSDSQAAFHAFSMNVNLRYDLSTAAVSTFERSLREQLPVFVQALLELSVHEVRAREEKRVKLPLPWHGPIPQRLTPGGRRGNALRYYLKVEAQRQRTGKSRLAIFAESASEERAKTRYYDGQKVYKYLRSRYLLSRR